MADTPTHYLITCVAHGGATKPFLSRLARDKGVWSFFYSGSRLARADHNRARGRIVQFLENEEISILVEAARLEEITAFCWEQLHLGEPGRGVLRVVRVEQAAPMVAPEEPVA